MSEEEDMQHLKDACARLGEHFENVQIFASKVQDKEDGAEGTVSVHYGTGNWFARKGQVDEWVLKHDERSRKEVREEE